MISIFKRRTFAIGLAAAVIGMQVSCGGGGDSGGGGLSTGAGPSGKALDESPVSITEKITSIAMADLPASQHVDGIGSAARFVSPGQMTIDRSGNQYVLDRMPDGDGIIRKITPEGNVTTLTGAVSGGGDNLLRWSGGLSGISVDGQGILYVAYGNAIEKIDAAGVVSTLAGKIEETGYQDGVGADARFTWPSRFVADLDGTIYLCDNYNSGTIRKITVQGVVTTFAGSLNNPKYNNGIYTWADGVGEDAKFTSPKAIAIDAQSNLYVLDERRIRKVTPQRAVTTIAGSDNLLRVDYLDGPGPLAGFGSYGGSLAVDANGIAYLADYGNNVIRKIASDGQISTFAGAQYPRWYINSEGYGMEAEMLYTDGVAQVAQFGALGGISITSDNTLYVVDGGNFVVRKVSPEGTVTTWAGARSKPSLPTNP